MKPTRLMPGDKTSNGVAIEIVHADNLSIVGRPALTPLGAHRVSTGSWTVPVRARITLRLEDGRDIEVDATVALKGRQIGRKPRAVKP